MRRELTLDKLWHLRTWGEIFKHFSTALMISALPTFFDMFTDAFSAKSFINGKNYTKFVTNLSNPAFHEKCVHVGRYITFQPEEEIQYEEIECFETDVIWGGVTVLLIFLPGFFFAVDVSIIISEVMQNKVGCCTLLLLLPTMLIFPVVLVLVKLVGLVNPGPEWRRMAIWLTSMEGAWESSMQLLVTLFIIFSRADRRPAWWQVASLVASMVLVTKTAIAHHLRIDGLSAKEELKKTALLSLSSSPTPRSRSCLWRSASRFSGTGLSLSAFFSQSFSSGVLDPSGGTLTLVGRIT